MFLRDIESLSASGPPVLSYLYVSLSNICNARCSYCDVHSASPPVWRYGASEVRRVLKEARDLGCRTVHFLGGGEPLVDPRFAAAAGYCGELGLRVVITTNGSHLEHQLRGPLRGVEVDTVVVSLDSHLAELHDRVRGMRGLFASALAGIECARRSAAGARLVINHVVTRDNAAAIQEFLLFTAQLGANAVNFIPVKDRGDMSVPADEACGFAERIGNARKLARTLGMDALVDDSAVSDWAGLALGHAPAHEYRCFFPYHALYVDFPTGDAFPCDCTVHRQPQSRFTAGNICDQSLAEIWTGKPIEDLRQVLESPCDPGCKQDCDWNNMRTNAQFVQLHDIAIHSQSAGAI